MIKYGVKMPSGRWLNNEYHKRISRSYGPDAVPYPEEGEEPRLFNSPSGARSSLGYRATSAIRALLPDHLRDYKAPQHPWSQEDRDTYFAFWREVHKVYASLKGQAYWDTLARDGYTLVPLTIKEQT